MIEQALLRTFAFVFSAAVLCAGGCKDTSSPSSGVPGASVGPGGEGGTVAANPTVEAKPEATPVATATAGESEVPPGPNDSTFVECTVRTDICTREYMPVCATLTDGSHRSYPNKCVACSDLAVRGYVAGACPEDQPPT